MTCRFASFAAALLLGASACGGNGDASSNAGGTGSTSGGTGYASGGTSSTSGGANGSGASSSAGANSSGASGNGGSSSSQAGSSQGGTSEGGAQNGGAGIGNGWSLVWSDEFDGDAVDAANWEHEVNCWGGGNNEQQCYVADSKNAFVEDGMLHLVALADSPTAEIGGPDNDPTVVTRPYSSARLTSSGKADFKYGRIEAKLQLPYGQGLWPAFWMLPTDNVYGGWAASGEIDIMEAINLAPDNNKIYGTLHYGGAWPANVHTGADTTPPDNVWEGPHVYAVEWQEGEVRWFVDDTHYETQTNWSTTEAPFPAPFDQEFHILLNVAVGGAWPGPPNGETTFPQEMVVDYVRVYQCESDPVTGVGCGTSDPNIDPL